MCFNLCLFLFPSQIYSTSEAAIAASTATFMAFGLLFLFGAPFFAYYNFVRALQKATAATVESEGERGDFKNIGALKTRITARKYEAAQYRRGGVDLNSETNL